MSLQKNMTEEDTKLSQSPAFTGNNQVCIFKHLYKILIGGVFMGGQGTLQSP